jgi:hypothetical protein
MIFQQHRGDDADDAAAEDIESDGETRLIGLETGAPSAFGL